MIIKRTVSSTDVRKYDMPNVEVFIRYEHKVHIIFYPNCYRYKSGHIECDLASEDFSVKAEKCVEYWMIPAGMVKPTAGLKQRITDEIIAAFAQFSMEHQL